jgi:hypothetical protein
MRHTITGTIAITYDTGEIDPDTGYGLPGWAWELRFPDHDIQVDVARQYCLDQALSELGRVISDEISQAGIRALSSTETEP